MPTVRSSDLEASREFYVGLLGFDVGMDDTGFLMLHSSSVPTTQLIVASEQADDRGVLLTDFSLEVSNVEEIYAEAQRRGLEIVYPITDEPWGIRRFFVRDPDGHVVNVASHRTT